jgi:hypothetical protein
MFLLSDNSLSEYLSCEKILRRTIGDSPTNPWTKGYNLTLYESQQEQDAIIHYRKWKERFRYMSQLIQEQETSNDDTIEFLHLDTSNTFQGEESSTHVKWRHMTFIITQTYCRLMRYDIEVMNLQFKWYNDQQIFVPNPHVLYLMLQRRGFYCPWTCRNACIWYEGCRCFSPPLLGLSTRYRQ